jgi:hypothetical protein
MKRISLLLLVLCSACGGTSIDAIGGSPSSGEQRGSDQPDAGEQHLPAGPSGLPCALETTLKDRCWSCHAAPLTAPSRLATREDLLKPSKAAPELLVVQVAVDRMRGIGPRMPPSPNATVPDSEVAPFQTWINDSYPSGSCGISQADGGVAADAGIFDPYDTPTACTSQKFWSRGDDGSDQMHPGRACISCHTEERKDFFKLFKVPDFDIAGTVYPSAHEPDDCVGTPGVDVVITDAKGKVFTLSVNGSGNFKHDKFLSDLTLPYRAKLVAGGKERAMSAAQQNGDCNSCHTEHGAEKAPGRLMRP